MPRARGGARGPATPLRQRDVDRAVRWLRRSGGLEAASREARDLLAARLAIRHRITRWAMAVMVIPGVALLVELARAVTSASTADLVPELPLVFLGSFCWFAVVSVVQRLREVAADRTVAAGLSRRVEREQAAPLAVVLGGAQVASMWVGATSVVVFDVLLWAYRPFWLAAAVTAAHVVVGVSAVWALALVLRRRAVAVDGYSLAIDERLRSEEASEWGARPFALMLLVTQVQFAGQAGDVHGAAPLPDWWFLLLVLAFVAVVVLGLVADSRTPWQSRRAARWSAQIRVVPRS